MKLIEPKYLNIRLNEELRAFYEWLENNFLSNHAQLLWLKLTLFNFKERNPEEFDVSNEDILATMYGRGSSVKALERYRKELAEVGRIYWLCNGSNRPASYYINPFFGINRTLANLIENNFIKPSENHFTEQELKRKKIDTRYSKYPERIRVISGS